MIGETTPIFSFSPVVTIEIGVTSDPVPEVVGTRINGSRGPFAGRTPNTWASVSRPGASNATSFGAIERRPAAKADNAGRAETCRRLDGVEDHRGGRIRRDVGKDFGLNARFAQKAHDATDDAGRNHARVGDDKHTLAESFVRDRADFAIAPGPNWMLPLVLKMNAFIGFSRFAVSVRISTPAPRRRPRRRSAPTGAPAHGRCKRAPTYRNS